MNIVEINNLYKYYDTYAALKDITVNIKENEVHGIIGPNGAGKSTLINILSGLIKFDSGKCNLFNLDMTTNKKIIQKNIGVVTQDYSIYDDLKARENVEFFGRIAGIKSEQLKKNVDESLKLVDLYEYKDKFPSTFSGGMKRRLNIACTLVHNPKLLILDEPTASLDPISRMKILNIVRDINLKGTTIVYTSHYLDELEKVCTNITMLNKGLIIKSGTRDEILKNFSRCKDKITLILDNVDHKSLVFLENLKYAMIISGLLKVTPLFKRENRGSYKLEIATENSSRLVSKLLPMLDDRKIWLRDIEVRKGNLEDVFLDALN